MRNETNSLDEFRDKFRVTELQIVNTGAWTWSVRPAQPTLGAGIISLNRYALKLSEVTPGEMADLCGLISTLEHAVKEAFNYDIMNYLMLMMVDHQVHYHVIPRYDGPREFSNLQWLDNGWPALPVLPDAQYKGQDEVLQSIQDKLIAEVMENTKQKQRAML